MEKVTNDVTKTHTNLKDLSLIASALYQIYGELNRIRLILGEKSLRGEKIEKFDKEKNHYIPFFDNEQNFEQYYKNNPTL